MHATEAIEKLISEYGFQTVLDVGAGEGAHARVFKHHGKVLTACDLAGDGPDVSRMADESRVGEYLDIEFEEPFDCIWCSHVLDQQRNVGVFLEKMFRDLKPGGVLAITVPPRRPNVGGGRLTIWNAGLLLYNLVLAGFDCSSARVKQYGNNISVIVRRQEAEVDACEPARGERDIERLARYFPFDASQDFNGDIAELNW